MIGWIFCILHRPHSGPALDLREKTAPSRREGSTSSRQSVQNPSPHQGKNWLSSTGELCPGRRLRQTDGRESERDCSRTPVPHWPLEKEPSHSRIQQVPTLRPALWGKVCCPQRLPLFHPARPQIEDDRLFILPKHHADSVGKKNCSPPAILQRTDLRQGTNGHPWVSRRVSYPLSAMPLLPGKGQSAAIAGFVRVNSQLVVQI